MELLGVNVLTTILAGAVAFGIGMLWYGPLFGKTWMQLIGMKKKDLKKAEKKDVRRTLTISAVGQLVTAYAVGMLVYLTGAIGALQGAFLGFVAGIGFIATSSLNPVLWEGKSWALWRFNNLYHLVVTVVIGMIFGAWA